MFSKWRISSQNYYLQSERGLQQYIDLVKAKDEASTPPPPGPTQLHPFEKLLAYEI